MINAEAILESYRAEIYPIVMSTWNAESWADICLHEWHTYELELIDAYLYNI